MSLAFQKWQDLLLKLVKSWCQPRGENQPRGEKSQLGYRMSGKRIVWE